MAPKPQPLWHDDEPASIGVDNPLWHSDWEMDVDPLLLEEASLNELNLHRSELSNNLSQPKSQVQRSLSSASPSDFTSSFYGSTGLSLDSNGNRGRPKSGAQDLCCPFFIVIAFGAACFYFVTQTGHGMESASGFTFEPYTCPALTGREASNVELSTGPSKLHELMEDFSRLGDICAEDESEQAECMCLNPTAPLDYVDNTAAADALFPQWPTDIKTSMEAADASTQVNGGEDIDVVFLGEPVSGLGDILDQVRGLQVGASNERSSSLLYRLEKGLPEKLNPKVWWITIGSNDVADMCDLRGVHAGIAQIIIKLEELRPEASIILTSLESTTEDFKTRQLNQRIKCLADTSENVTFFNQFPGAQDSDVELDMTYHASSPASGKTMLEVIQSYL